MCKIGLRELRDNEACIQVGQENPLMNKKGLTVNKLNLFI
jgi:hypothetical protein